MTREQIKKFLPIIQAFADGKAIQFFNKGTETWNDIKEPAFVLDLEYRVKPQEEYRPFKDAQECMQEMQKHEPFGWIVKEGIYTAITSITDTRVRSGSFYCSYQEALQYETFADGTPFGIKKED